MGIHKKSLLVGLQTNLTSRSQDFRIQLVVDEDTSALPIILFACLCSFYDFFYWGYEFPS